MPKSKLRGGAKAHRKRVAHRNALIKSEKKKFQKAYQDLLEKSMQEINSQLSGHTELLEGIDVPSTEIETPYQPIEKTL